LAAPGTIIVTGASSGIGRAIAEHLATTGFDVVGTSRSTVGFERLDITDEASCTALVERVLGHTGRIDGLVNNAGQAMLGAQEECTTEEVRALFEVNVFGAMRMPKAVLPAMRAAKRGRIINIVRWWDASQPPSWAPMARRSTRSGEDVGEGGTRGKVAWKAGPLGRLVAGRRAAYRY
jgi:NAD(P)-dependent dehydrogenase (short-subunit alcohol dehydrogenase family)